jgi:uncharacterized protein (DUF2252 family)
MADFFADNMQYEFWLRSQCDVVEDGLRKKYERMAESPFKFLRATYFRWAKRADEFAAECMDDPAVLAVGDCHIENFGTWRDADGRLVWGANDYDDAAVMPYSLDLLRLATSVRLAGEFDLAPRAACEQILAGYRAGLSAPGPVLLDEGDQWLKFVINQLEDDSDKFWAGLEESKPAPAVPVNVRDLLALAMPPGAKVKRVSAWQKGGGSLGRPRYLAVAQWQGGRVVREAKLLVPSGWSWAHGHDEQRVRFLDAAQGKHRSPDAVLTARDGYILRRLAPDTQKLSAKQLARSGSAADVLQAMGHEVGAIHAVHKHAGKVLAHVSERRKGWLNALSADAEAFVRADYDAWARPP